MGRTHYCLACDGGRLPRPRAEGREVSGRKPEDHHRGVREGRHAGRRADTGAEQGRVEEREFCAKEAWAEPEQDGPATCRL